ncbi:hypothetical protein BN1708_010793 [Verticillium longisporum]|uniref:non-specific serine/threonine protein kinase n=1 Tax=Verticillium longisporum TaxID=100787 RepID=A0A0G4KVF3_VERLO|nr:hypothetical protein BN1708_010793 [Verticillium longisporum]
MLRRPPGEGRSGAQQRKSLLALAVLFLTCLPLVEGQQQQQQQAGAQSLHHVRHADQQHNARSAHGHEGFDALAGDVWAETDNDVAAADALTSKLREDTVMDDNNNNHNKKKRNIIINTKKNKNDARAVATLAPAQSVRAPSPGYRPSAHLNGGSGISSPQRARSLEEWEVEDFILLATVDGDLYASDRRSGAQRWHLEVEQPMVQTEHFRLNASDLDEDHQDVDHYIWAVEPTRDGSLYIWMTGASEPALVPTGLTMKRLVEDLSPLANDDPPVIYTGAKKTTMITIDAATGRVLKWFGSSGSHINEESCLRPNALSDVDSEECSVMGTITLGRTEYEVAITRKDGRAIAKLNYSEWTPNNFDKDLVDSYSRTLDNRYHSSRHDGRVYAFDPEDQPLFSHQFAAPVARVFDVCRPWGATPDKNPDLLVLPQPIPAPKDEVTARMRGSHVFLNQTDAGSWYALSGYSYPLIVDSPPALTSRSDWGSFNRPWSRLTQSQKADAMIGRHNFKQANHDRGQVQPPTLPGSPISHPAMDSPDDATLPSVVPDEILDPLDPHNIVEKVKSIPQQAANSVRDLLSNPVLIIVLVGAFFFYHKDLIRWYKNKSNKWLLQRDHRSEAGDPTPEPTPNHSIDGRILPLSKSDEIIGKSDDKVAPMESAQTQAREVPPVQTDDIVSTTDNEGPAPSATESRDKKEDDREASATQASDSPESNESSSKAELEPGTPAEKKKAKAHRGRRGGVKHRKGAAKKREMSQSRDDDPPATTVEDAVKNAQKLGGSPKLEPDVVTVANDMQSVTGPVIKLGNIEVDTDNQLGTGSNGTLVFAGKFDGREVAVKRMLIQFYDIASQETRLLRESDDHPNVIRYYAQEFRDGFLYIALERCAASLADVVERPGRFPKVAAAGRADLPGVLYQITNGIDHLHNLRIVHRDLKPQNILVNTGKDGRPRLLVSDFGLCKKLEGGQSSFGATTGRAAGTTGWRAPELLVDDDKDPLTDVSINSGSGTVLVNSEMLPNRRATRSIDIFSLGLVFYYVLTNGLHPFDCGDRYMREVNIRKGNYNLAPLDALGDFAYEAKDLIGSMLNGDPKSRPSTRDVMAHPFFWSAKKRLAFLCDVSDHFEKEPRDPPSAHLSELESHAPDVTRGDFLRHLPREFVDSLGKQRKYNGPRLLDLLRALRNKRNHYEDMPDTLKRAVGPLPEGYLAFWTIRFPGLLLACWNVVWDVRWDSTDRFREYYEPAGL